METGREREKLIDYYINIPSTRSLLMKGRDETGLWRGERKV